MGMCADEGCTQNEDIERKTLQECRDRGKVQIICDRNGQLDILCCQNK